MLRSGQGHDRREFPEPARSAGNVDSDAVDQLLEHLSVVALLGRFVRGVAKLR